MRSSELSGDAVTVAAVIGGGASGTLTAACTLLAATAARAPVSILLIDRDGRHGLGRAYATSHPAHLLNSPAGRMSAVPGDPGSLVRWAQADGLAAGPGSFLTRSDFGRYLRDVLDEAERAAAPAARVRRLTAEVVGLTTGGEPVAPDPRRTAAARQRAPRRPGGRQAPATDPLQDLRPPGSPVRLHLGDGGHLDVDVAVLATGSLPPEPPCPVPDTVRYVADPWSPGALAGITDGSPVAILGTGLTMLDVAIAVTDSHPDTIVYAVSRHALLPREHQQWHGQELHEDLTARLRVIQELTDGQRGLSGLVRRIRAEAEQSPAGWQPVIDALRPYSQQVWQYLSEREQRTFLQHVARYWEVHRHRVPPATASRIAALMAGGRLRVLRGRATQVRADTSGLEVLIEGSPGLATIRAGWLVNGTGPGTDVSSTRDRLLRQLLDAGLAAPDPHRLGIRVDGHGAVLTAAGQPSSWLYALGPLLRGELYETTAVPEIRDQASALARRLVALAAPKSAA